MMEHGCKYRVKQAVEFLVMEKDNSGYKTEDAKENKNCFGAIDTRLCGIVTTYISRHSHQKDSYRTHIALT